MVIPAPVVGSGATAAGRSGATTGYGDTIGVVTTTVEGDGASGTTRSSCWITSHPASSVAAATPVRTPAVEAGWRRRTVRPATGWRRRPR
ncbi:hypothetical protein MTP03_02060 [Tsukamurella sp. PLM1]|nr:hypothetical protein MTP03_02060 [Tsukamurella sp. PLM1]